MDDSQLYGIVRTVDDIAYGGLGNAAFHIADTASFYAPPAILKGVC